MQIYRLLMDNELGEKNAEKSKYLTNLQISAK